jgi:hypothetical protein
MRGIFFLLCVLALPVAVAEAQERRLPGMPAEKDPSYNPCTDLDRADVEAVYNCVVYYDPELTLGRRYGSQRVYMMNWVEPKYRPGSSCDELQRFIYIKTGKADGRSQSESQLAWKQIYRNPDAVPRVDCAVIADVIDAVSGQRPHWDACVGYDETSDKKAHLKACVIGYMTSWQMRGNREQAAAKAAKMGCEEVRSTYESFLGQVYPHYAFPELKGAAIRLPVTYSQMDCLDIATIEFQQ